VDLLRDRLRLDGAHAVVPRGGAGRRGGRSAVVAAQTLDAEFVRSFTERWVNAWNAHNPDALLALCTEDIVWEDPAAPEPSRGHDEVRTFLQTIWTIFPDLSFTLPEPALVALEGPRAAQVWRLTGTFLGPDPTGFAPTGKHVDQLGIDHYEFRDGLLAHYQALYDVSESLRQMGLAPARGSRPERAMAFMQRTSMKLRRKPKSG
jgi:steroid delta-isomerase-like uncharacterized protein